MILLEFFFNISRMPLLFITIYRDSSHKCCDTLYCDLHNVYIVFSFIYKYIGIYMTKEKKHAPNSTLSP